MNTHESIIRLYSGIGLFFTSFVFANTPIQEGYVQFSDISITQFLSGFFLCGLLITISQLMRYRSSQMYIFNKEAGMI